MKKEAEKKNIRTLSLFDSTINMAKEMVQDKRFQSVSHAVDMLILKEYRKYKKEK